MFTLTYKREFHAAHHLSADSGPCRKNHGHNWIAEFTCQSDDLDDNGMLVHFDVLKSVCPDHEDLNEWMSAPPTTENVARELFDRLAAQGVPIMRVRLWENERASVTYERSIPQRIARELADFPFEELSAREIDALAAFWEKLGP